MWLIIKNCRYKNAYECLKSLKKKKIKISPWIENIFKKKKYKFRKKLFTVILCRIYVKDLGFKKPTELNKIYKKLKSLKYKLVPPQISLLVREKYTSQPKGEWLRFATPLKSMVDSDNVPHLPKLGSALGFKFIETYWSYPKAIFHPHNDFIVLKK